MAHYIEETIESVLSQNYPRIEYFVMDGGSRDGTLEILRRYRGRLRYVSQPDHGPGDAVNRGFSMGRGSIFAWLNADDTYLPGAVSAAIEYLLAHPQADVVYGEGLWIDAAGRTIAPYPTKNFDSDLLQRECFICQPACFLRSEAFRDSGMLNPALQYAFDYDLWIRISKRFRFERLPVPLATSRMHSGNKTLGERRKLYAENFQVLKYHYGYIPFGWIHSYCSYILDGRDQFFQPLRPTFSKYALSLPVGCRHNRDCMGRYVSEWRAVMSGGAFRRLLKRRWAAALGRAGAGPGKNRPVGRSV